MNPLFNTLVQQLNPTKRGKNMAIVCPCCSKPIPARGIHAAFTELGFKCFVCGAGFSLKELAERVQIENLDNAPAPIKIKRLPPPWLPYADGLQCRYTSHKNRYRIIQAYKPMPRATIDRFGVGVGDMPKFVGNDELDPSQWLDAKLWERMATRITIPLIKDGQIVGFSGRALSRYGAKWINATGSDRIVWGMKYADGRPAVIGENQFDAAWASGEDESRVYLATNGTSVSYQNIFDCVKELKARGTPSLLAMFDNDLPGQARGAMREALKAEWYEKNREILKKNPNARPQRSCVPDWATACRAVGLPFTVYDWQDAPPKMDLGRLLEIGYKIP